MWPVMEGSLVQWEWIRRPLRDKAAGGDTQDLGWRLPGVPRLKPRFTQRQGQQQRPGHISGLKPRSSEASKCPG